jgi:hypothetical protein
MSFATICTLIVGGDRGRACNVRRHNGSVPLRGR